jgi:tRNA/rRNA methyltransferase
MSKPVLRVILVKSLYESNVGATSRAMANMGVEQLILIAPQCAIGEVAQKAAATGQAALQNRKVYASWDEFNAGSPLSVRLAFTARDGRGRAVGDLKDTLTELLTARSFATLDLVFGPENWGLSNEDIDQCHYAVSIPTYGANPSLNLAQASSLALFITQSQLAVSQSPRRNETAEDQPGYLPETLVKTWIESLGFSLDDRRVNVHSVIRRLFLHAIPTQKEVQALEVALHQSVRKMKEYHQMRGLLGLEQDGREGRPLSDLLANRKQSDIENSV